MGDRANIAIKHIPAEGQQPQFIYLYSHWGGSELPETLQSALMRGKSRWGDGQYLNRIIFNQVTMGEEKELTGFGLSTYIGDGGRRVIEVDTDHNTVQVRGSSKVWTFDEYVALDFADRDPWEIAGGEA